MDEKGGRSAREWRQREVDGQREGGRNEKERDGESERAPRMVVRPYRERVEPRKNHKSNDLPVTPRTKRPVRSSTKMMKDAVMLSARTTTLGQRPTE